MLKEKKSHETDQQYLRLWNNIVVYYYNWPSQILLLKKKSEMLPFLSFPSHRWFPFCNEPQNHLSLPCIGYSSVNSSWPHHHSKERSRESLKISKIFPGSEINYWKIVRGSLGYSTKPQWKSPERAEKLQAYVWVYRDQWKALINALQISLSCSASVTALTWNTLLCKSRIF